MVLCRTGKLPSRFFCSDGVWDRVGYADSAGLWEALYRNVTDDWRPRSASGRTGRSEVCRSDPRYLAYWRRSSRLVERTPGWEDTQVRTLYTQGLLNALRDEKIPRFVHCTLKACWTHSEMRRYPGSYTVHSGLAECTPGWEDTQVRTLHSRLAECTPGWEDTQVRTLYTQGLLNALRDEKIPRFVHCTLKACWTHSGMRKYPGSYTTLKACWTHSGMRRYPGLYTVHSRLAECTPGWEDTQVCTLYTQGLLNALRDEKIPRFVHCTLKGLLNALRDEKIPRFVHYTQGLLNTLWDEEIPSSYTVHSGLAECTPGWEDTQVRTLHSRLAECTPGWEDTQVRTLYTQGLLNALRDEKIPRFVHCTLKACWTHSGMRKYPGSYTTLKACWTHSGIEKIPRFVHCTLKACWMHSGMRRYPGLYTVHSRLAERTPGWEDTQVCTLYTQGLLNALRDEKIPRFVHYTQGLLNALRDEKIPRFVHCTLKACWTHSGMRRYPGLYTVHSRLAEHTPGWEDTQVRTLHSRLAEHTLRWEDTQVRTLHTQGLLNTLRDEKIPRFVHCTLKACWTHSGMRRYPGSYTTLQAFWTHSWMRRYSGSYTVHSRLAECTPGWEDTQVRTLHSRLSERTPGWEDTQVRTLYTQGLLNALRDEKIPRFVHYTQGLLNALRDEKIPRFVHCTLKACWMYSGMRRYPGLYTTLKACWTHSGMRDTQVCTLYTQGLLNALRDEKIPRFVHYTQGLLNALRDEKIPRFVHCTLKACWTHSGMRRYPGLYTVHSRLAERTPGWEDTQVRTLYTQGLLNALRDEKIPQVCTLYTQGLLNALRDEKIPRFVHCTLKACWTHSGMRRYPGSYSQVKTTSLS